MCIVAVSILEQAFRSSSLNVAAALMLQVL
jgi:hypothetical protein